MIEVSQVSKIFDIKKVVEDVSFLVKPGETLVLLGTSGSGKTTILKMINRLIDPSSGQIKINDQDVLSYKPHILRRQIGYVIQQIGLFPHLNVFDNIRVIPDMLKWDQQKTNDRIHELMIMLGLPEQVILKKFPHELSGGQMQRIGIARALVSDPAIVLMDEPFGALDPITRSKVQKEFKKLESIIQKTIILVTHDVQEAFELGDKICLLDNGRLQQFGSPTELLFQPQNQFVRDFFNAHRHLLELKITPLSDIAPFLNFDNDTNAKKISLKSSYSLEEAISIIDKNMNKVCYYEIQDENGTLARFNHFHQLFSALYQFKEQHLNDN